MSRGLGPTQRRALVLLADAPGLTVRELADLLGCTPHRTRLVVTALDERRLVVIRKVDGKRRVFLPEQLGEWLRAEANRVAHAETVRHMTYRMDKDGICPCCGQALPKRPRPVPAPYRGRG